MGTKRPFQLKSAPPGVLAPSAKSVKNTGPAGLKGVFIKGDKAAFYKASPLYFEPVPPSFRFAAFGKKAQPIPGGARFQGEQAMAKWAIKDKAEFEARQAQFDFAIVARTVLDLTISLKKRLGKMFQAWKKGFCTYEVLKEPLQLVLPLEKNTGNFHA